MNFSKESYVNTTPTQRLIAILGAICGGAIVVILSLIATIGDINTLQRGGFTWGSIIFFGVVTLSGVGIMSKIPYSTIIALAAIAIDLSLDFITAFGQLGTVSLMYLVKFFILISILQLAKDLYPDDDEQQPLAPRGPQPPRPRSTVQQRYKYK